MTKYQGGEDPESRRRIAALMGAQHAPKIDASLPPSRPQARPWCCPEPRCTPLTNLKDGDYADIAVPEPGQSWFCWGVMAEAITFTYDGVTHENDCRSCSYTALKGVISFQENEADWDALCTMYGVAKRKLQAFKARLLPQGEPE